MTAGEPLVGRRTVLAGATVALGGIAGGALLAGGTGDGPSPVSMLVAGSLNDAVENGLKPRLDVPMRNEARGSAELARLVDEGQKDPDIVSVADVALFDSPLAPEWFAEFATNSIVVAYNPETDGGRRLGAAGPEEWYRPLMAGDVALGRTDPDLDPLGYRTLFTLELATEYYGTSTDLRAAIPSRDQRYPETQLVGQFETGGIDAAVTYRSMAVDRGYEYVELPAEIDLSDPAHADDYARTSYELPGGRVVRGAPISYGSTAPDVSPPVADVFRAHVTGEYLTEFGFVVPDDYPSYTGNVPHAVAN